MIKASAIFVAALVLGALAGRQAAQNQQSSAQPPQQAGQAQSASPISAATPRLEFDVASVKPTKPGAQPGGIRPLPGGQSYSAEGAPVRLMIRLMFHLTNSQVEGGPDWINTDLWDVQAKAEQPSNLDDLHTMFQNLIIDRFKLQFHYEDKTLPIFALEQDKSGSKMKLNPSPEPFDIPIQGVAFGQIKATHCSMSYLTWFLSGFPELSRPVADETSLPGFYDFTLAWAPQLPEAIANRPDIPPAPGPELFTAVREQLGLRLEAKKGPIKVMVIDHIEKPSGSDN